VSVLQRSAFLTAVTGYPAATAAGEDLVTSRLQANAERAPGSMSGSRQTPATQAQHVPQTAADDVNCPPEASGQQGFGQRWE